MGPLLRLRRRRRTTRPREVLFVGRVGVLGPELYRVGKTVRRLPGPGPAASAPLEFARQILADVMLCRPATRLAQALAEAHLCEPLSRDGFVVSGSDIEGWLHTRHVLGVPPR